MIAQQKNVSAFLFSMEDYYGTVLKNFGYELSIPQICFLNGSSALYNQPAVNEKEVIFQY